MQSANNAFGLIDLVRGKEEKEEKEEKGGKRKAYL